jgi:hypothetical protein
MVEYHVGALVALALSAGVRLLRHRCAALARYEGGWSSEDVYRRLAGADVREYGARACGASFASPRASGPGFGRSVMLLVLAVSRPGSASATRKGRAESLASELDVSASVGRRLTARRHLPAAVRGSRIRVAADCSESSLIGFGRSRDVCRTTTEPPPCGEAHQSLRRLVAAGSLSRCVGLPAPPA